MHDGIGRTRVLLLVLAACSVYQEYQALLRRHLMTFPNRQSCLLPGLLQMKLEVGRWKRLNPTGASQLPHFGVHRQVHWRKGLAHILYQLGNELGGDACMSSGSNESQNPCCGCALTANEDIAPEVSVKYAPALAC